MQRATDRTDSTQTSTSNGAADTAPTGPIGPAAGDRAESHRTAAASASAVEAVDEAVDEAVVEAADEAADVIVVGAGLAGLAAAHHLTSAGLRVTVLEGDERVGGRMAPDQVDGFRLDRTGQPFLTDWPELRRLPALGGLDLLPFTSGVLIRNGRRTHRLGEPRGARSTGGALATARALTNARTAVSALDQARLRVSLARIGATEVKRLLARRERSAADALVERGVPARTVDGFLRPLLAALLCDPDLTTSSRVADLALHGFARGRLCLPAGGTGAVPELLAATLPDGTVHTGIRALRVTANSVTTPYGVLGCRAVLVATGARAAAELLPGLRLPAFHPVTVLHHAADPAPPTGEEAALLLDADRGGPVSHTMVATAVDPSRALPERSLISSVVLGRQATEPVAELDRAARPQLGALHGARADRWQLLAAHQNTEAVPAMPAPHDRRRPVRVLSGLYVCGDHRDTSTPQGMLRSARRAAFALLRDFGLRPAGGAPIRAAA